jgi:Protein of unknown function (DUF3102)
VPAFEPPTAAITTDPVLAEHAAEIRRLGKRVIADVIEIGARLTECKRICGHGNWLPWLDREFGWTEMTATRFINVFDMSKSNNLLDLDLPISGLYLLAAPSGESARAAVLDLAANGERVTHAQIKDTIEQARGGLRTGVAMSPHAERGLDAYETPAPATRALLKVESLDGTIWEPACGPGSIVRVLSEAGHRVIATDLVDYKCPGALAGVDFLSQTAAPKDAATILTNPPFKHADAFVRHAVTLVPRVIMLLRFLFVESEGRSDILDGGQLARVYVFRNRLLMHRAGWDGPKIDSGAIAFAWFVWERDHCGPAQLQRISWDADDEVQIALSPPDTAASGDGLEIPGFLRRAAP